MKNGNIINPNYFMIIFFRKLIFTTRQKKGVFFVLHFQLIFYPYDTFNTNIPCWQNQHTSKIKYEKCEYNKSKV